MADSKISALASGAPAQAGDEYVVARSGANFKLSGADVAAGSVANFSNGLFFRNRIINGDMRIDQRNAGSAVTTTATFPVDRFTQAFGNASCSFQQVADAPTGFVNSLKLTVTTGSAPSVGTNNVILQRIEGLNVADLAFGTASALTVTVSFWAKASVTGTYAVSLTNSAFNRSYVATYAINSANTWEYKTVTIAGDTTGTWLTTNGTGLIVLWDFGSGTNLNTTAGAWQAGNFYRTSACTTIASTTNATLQITGVQLETGSVATPFERRPYGTELMLCQRYYIKWLNSSSNAHYAFTGINISSTRSFHNLFLPVAMRASPSLAEVGALVGDAVGSNVDVTAISTYAASTNGNSISVDVTHASGYTTSVPVFLALTGSTGYIEASIEL